jgi:hypothetical protein
VKEQIIRLEPHDDIISVRDKLGWIRAPRVLLVFPEDPRVRILQDKLDLVLIQREVTRRRAQLALITRDPAVVEHARDLGIACFGSIEASHRRYWRTARARLAVARSERATPLDPALIEAATRLDTEQAALPPAGRRAVALTTLALALAVLLAGLAAIAPGATVHLTPASNQVTVTTAITADPAVDPGLVDTAAGLIAARTVGVETESSIAVDVTGTALQPSQKALGIVLFTNLIPEQVTIPAGTVVRTSAARPVRFVTLSDITLPGKLGETAQVPVEAVEAGFTGNLPAGRINQIEGPLGVRVGVTNAEPTTGGDAVEIPAVAEQDYQRARALLLQQLQQRAFAEMQSKLLSDTEFVPPESLAVVLIHSETYSAAIGQAAGRLTLNMRVTVQGIAVDERLARQIVYARLTEKVGIGLQIGAGSLVFRRSDVTRIDEQQRVTFVMQGAGDVSTAVDTTRVLQLVRGVSVREAELRLNRELPLGAPARIETWPRFWPQMPLLPLRIRVVVDGQA